MSENLANNKDVRNDEIDLLDLFRRIGKTLNRWFNGLFKAFLISIVFMLRRWLPLSLSVVCAVAVSLLMRNSSESFFTSDLVLRVNIEPTDEVISHVNRLHTFCIEENKESLAKSISLTSAQTDNILDIQAFWIIDNGRDDIPDFTDFEEDHDVYDTVNVRMQDRLDIRVRIMQPQELTNVRDGILKFITSDPLFQLRNDLRLRQNNEMLTRLEYDLDQLDSLQKFKYFEESRNLLPKMGSQMIFLQEQKTQLLHSDIYNLYYQKQTLEFERDLYKGMVTVLSDFSVPAERDNGGLYYGKTFIPLFFFITLLFLIIIANRKKLKEVYNKY